MSSEDVNKVANAQRLKKLEAIIESGLKSFIAVGLALTEIREARLYKELGYKNFESYCTERWKIKRSYASRQIKAAKVVENLKQLTIVNKIPSAESQIRSIVNLEPEQQCNIWSEAVKCAGDTIPTGSLVKEVKERLMKQQIEEGQTLDSKEFPAIEVGDICIIQAKDESALKRYSGFPCAIKTKNEHSYDIDVFDRTLELIKPEYLIKQDYSEPDRAAAIALIARLQKIAAVETISRAINVILLEFGSRFIFPLSDRDEAILSFIEGNLGITQN